MTTVRFRRAAAQNPGKHGAADWRVTLDGNPPEHAELIFMLGMVLIAEDRYNAPGNLGRYMLWQFVDLLTHAKTPERVLEIAADCHASEHGFKARRVA